MTADLREQLQHALGIAYTLERELGGGGMSRVFVATEAALGREVVVKVLTPELAAGVSAVRFAREVKLAARLQHPNIVPLLSAGDAGGLPYYTMPFVRGESLRARLASGGALPPGEAVNVLRDTARALAYAHGEGVVHRDIKPDNVLLSGGVAVVADFGIAKALSASMTQEGPAGGTAELTQLGSSIGTPAYMAPEQAAGDPGTTHRADLYAWGVMAYELLAGRHPFAGRVTPQALLAAHLSEAPAPLTVPRGVVPPSVLALVMRCLEKDPARRPGSAGELLQILDSANTPSGPLTAPGRRPTLRIGALSVAGLAVVALGYVALGRREPGTAPVPAEARSLAVLPFESIGGDTANTYFAEGMADELATALAKVPGLKLAGRSSAFAFRGKRARAQEVGQALRVGAVLEGTVRRAGGRMRVSTQLTDAGDGLVLWSESYEREVKDVFAVQDDIARAIVTALRVTLTGGTPAATADRGTSDLEAYDLYLRGMYFYQRRGASLPIAVESFSKAIAKDSGFARAYAGLSMALTGLTVYTNSPAGSVLPPALVAAERATALDPALAEAFLATGIAQFFSYRWSETEAAFRRAIVLDSTLALARLWYGRFLYAVGRIDEGVLQLERAKALDPLSAANAASLAYGLSLADRHSDAIADARRALEIDSLLLPAQTNLLLALVNGGRLPEARAAAERILRSPTDITVQGMAAYAFGMAGDRPRAAALAGEIIRNHAGEWRVQTAALRAFLGAGDTAQALTAMERAVAAGEPFVINLSLVDHLYDSVRGSARFAALVRRVGLEERLFLQRRER